MSSPLTLDSLPVEVIQRIAGYSTAESVLNLLKVNRKLYSTCDDDLVFKAVIRNGNGDPAATPWNIDSLSHIKTGWARLAIADARARCWANVKPDHEYYSQLSRENILKWVAQLIALRHPLISDVSYARVLEEMPIDDWGVFEFCVVAALTHQLPDVLNLKYTNGGVDMEVGGRLNTLVTMVRKGTDSDLDCLFVGCTIGYNTIRSNRHPLPPVPSRIPFAELISLPAPFSEMTQLSQSYLPRMTSASFLTKGEWVGYYTNSEGMLSVRGRFDDPPMEGIFFEATPHAEIPNALELSGSGGVDLAGGFTLKGIINQHGVVVLRKSYIVHGWDWKANMTPFGIMGAWGNDNLRFGYFWLWKREWSDVRAPNSSPSENISTGWAIGKALANR